MRTGNTPRAHAQRRLIAEAGRVSAQIPTQIASVTVRISKAEARDLVGQGINIRCLRTREDRPVIVLSWSFTHGVREEPAAHGPQCFHQREETP